MRSAFVSNRSLALVLALTLCLSTAGLASAKTWIPIIFYNSASSGFSQVNVTMDGLKTIGKNTTGGFLAGSTTGVASAGAAAAGIISTPATPLAYAVPVVAGTVGGFVKGVNDALWDGNLKLIKW